MVIRRCPKCHTTSDDQYGFCIKCGYEFPELEVDANTCPLCNYSNPEEADYCVKCGSPLIFKKQFEQEQSLNPIIIQRKISEDAQRINYLITRKDPVAKKHGRIQLAIFIFYLVLILILILTGVINTDTLMNYSQMNFANLTNVTL